MIGGDRRVWTMARRKQRRNQRPNFLIEKDLHTDSVAVQKRVGNELCPPSGNVSTAHAQLMKFDEKGLPTRTDLLACLKRTAPI